MHTHTDTHTPGPQSVCDDGVCHPTDFRATMNRRLPAVLEGEAVFPFCWSCDLLRSQHCWGLDCNLFDLVFSVSLKQQCVHVQWISRRFKQLNVFNRSELLFTCKSHMENTKNKNSINLKSFQSISLSTFSSDPSQFTTSPMSGQGSTAPGSKTRRPGVPSRIDLGPGPEVSDIQ